MFGSVLMFRCRTNTLRLVRRGGVSGGAEEEHFVMKCEGIRLIRERHGVRGGGRVEEALLFEGRTEGRVDGFTKMPEEMWADRERDRDAVI